MILDMVKKVMTELDTFDTLKYGHIPLNHLLDYAITKKIDISNFQYENGTLQYKNLISLYFDGDFYYIDLFISEPGYDDGEDIHNQVGIHFYFGVHIDKEEKRDYPHLIFDDEQYYISNREQFVEILQYDWNIFVKKSIGEILRHRLSILENLDDIIKLENNIQYKSNKTDYIKVLDNVVDHISNNIENMILFKKVKNWSD